MDVQAGLEGISRDVGELFDSAVMAVVAVLTFALPPASALLVVLRRRLAVVPLAISLGLFAVWFLYYATEWWANPGVVAWLYGFVFVVAGWGLVVAAAVRRER